MGHVPPPPPSPTPKPPFRTVRSGWDLHNSLDDQRKEQIRKHVREARKILALVLALVIFFVLVGLSWSTKMPAAKRLPDPSPPSIPTEFEDAQPSPSVKEKIIKSAEREFWERVYCAALQGQLASRGESLSSSDIVFIIDTARKIADQSLLDRIEADKK